MHLGWGKKGTAQLLIKGESLKIATSIIFFKNTCFVRNQRSRHELLARTHMGTRGNSSLVSCFRCSLLLNRVHGNKYYPTVTANIPNLIYKQPFMQKQKYKYVKQNNLHAHFFLVAYITWTLLSALKINTNIIISYDFERNTAYIITVICSAWTNKPLEQLHFHTPE